MVQAKPTHEDRVARSSWLGWLPSEARWSLGSWISKKIMADNHNCESLWAYVEGGISIDNSISRPVNTSCEEIWWHICNDCHTWWYSIKCVLDCTDPFLFLVGGEVEVGWGRVHFHVLLNVYPLNIRKIFGFINCCNWSGSRTKISHFLSYTSMCLFIEQIVTDSCMLDTCSSLLEKDLEVFRDVKKSSEVVFSPLEDCLELRTGLRHVHEAEVGPRNIDDLRLCNS